MCPRLWGPPPLERFVVSAGRRTARLDLVDGRAVSRAALDDALVEAARAAGASWWPGARVRLGGLRGARRTVEVTDEAGVREVHASVVLDATGLGGQLGAGSGTEVAAGSRMGLGATFDDRQYPVTVGDLHMAVGRTGYVGLVRIESGALNIAAALDPGCLKRSTPADAVAEILTSAGLPTVGGAASADWRGTPLLTRTPDDFGEDRLLRLGDAAGYVEPFTGEGMCWAMSAGVAVAPLALEAATRWTPEVLRRWRRYNRRTLASARKLCSVLTPLLRRPRLVSTAIAALEAAPSLATPLVTMAARPPRPAGATSV